MDNEIIHTGFVQRIEGNTVFVKIVQQSACAGCHAKSMCGASESKEKIIEIPVSSLAVDLNEEVIVTGKSTLGLLAVLLAFIIPLTLVVATLIAGHILHWDEGIMALFGLFMLIPYYGLLYWQRDVLKRKFIFTLKKIKE